MNISESFCTVQGLTQHFHLAALRDSERVERVLKFKFKFIMSRRDSDSDCQRDSVRPGRARAGQAVIEPSPSVTRTVTPSLSRTGPSPGSGLPLRAGPGPVLPPPRADSLASGRLSLTVQSRECSVSGGLRL